MNVRVVVLEHRPELNELVARIEVELGGRRLVALERANLGYPRRANGKLDRQAIGRRASELAEAFLRNVARLDPERPMVAQRLERRTR